MNNLSLRARALVITICCIASTAHARQSLEEHSDSTNAARSGIYPLPIIFYTPETGIAGGAAALYLYRDSKSPRASTVAGDIIYTEKKQIIVEFSGDLYFLGGTYRLLTNLKFQKYPNKFFGVGNNTPELNEENYTSQRFLFEAVLYRNIFSHLNAGPAIRAEHGSMKETVPGGLLAAGAIPGSNGGTLACIGFVANWDSRDNTISAQSGSLYQVTTLFYHRAFGSDYNFTDVQIDTRNFFEVLPDQVLAVQAAAELTDGTPPFDRMANFGGQNLIRGYFDGRYRDKNGIAVQAEYRLPVWWRFGMVGFAGAAQVADRIGQLGLKRFWLAGGIGLRFAWNPEERVNLRLDYGWGNNSSGMYITVTEAF
jgi:outer membrane protein assembly factor BamA